MELEADYKRERGSGNGSETAYAVEARYTFHDPLVLGDQVFDNRWRRVKFVQSAVGVPAAPSCYRQTLEHGLLAYAAAQALRWWLHANADANGHGGLCLETRLVAHRITYSHKIEAISAHGHIHGGDRSNCVPDWGVRAQSTTQPVNQSVAQTEEPR
jgi:hypothetical protein